MITNISELMQDWANPLVRPYIQIYPKLTTCVSQSWQAAKWTKEIDFDDLTPMWADWDNAPHQHYFVKELAQTADGDFVIPVRFIQYKKFVYVDVYATDLEMNRVVQSSHFSLHF
jgi:hypothetical protein